MSSFEVTGSRKRIAAGLCLAALSSISLLASAYAPFSERVFEQPTTFANENDGTWALTSWGGPPSLAFIKTANTPDNHVEVHVASGLSNFRTRVFERPTTFVNETDGVWTLADWDNDGKPDLIFIKTNNTPNGHVEVHVASGSSGYQTRTFEAPTTFGNETDGTWLMSDCDGDGRPDLVFIKTSNTPNGHVEVHVASAKSNYQTRIIETATTFVNETDGTWLLSDWDGDGRPDLTFVKTSGTPNGHVEVHIASASSNYQARILETPTTFANESDGVWLMAPRHGKADLVFIKTSNTPDGHVEVHMAGAEPPPPPPPPSRANQIGGWCKSYKGRADTDHTCVGVVEMCWDDCVLPDTSKKYWEAPYACGACLVFDFD